MKYFKYSFIFLFIILTLSCSDSDSETEIKLISLYPEEMNYYDLQHFFYVKGIVEYEYNSNLIVKARINLEDWFEDKVHVTPGSNIYRFSVMGIPDSVNIDSDNRIDLQILAETGKSLEKTFYIRHNDLPEVVIDSYPNPIPTQMYTFSGKIINEISDITNTSIRVSSAYNKREYDLPLNEDNTWSITIPLDYGHNVLSIYVSDEYSSSSDAFNVTYQPE